MSEAETEADESGMTLGEMFAALRQNLWLLTLGPLAAGLTALGITGLIAPTFTASTTLLPPQQGQSSAASALASLGSLGSLAGLAGGAAGISSPGERYVALMQSVTLSDRIVEQFKLMEVYEERFRVDARKALASNVRSGRSLASCSASPPAAPWPLPSTPPSNLPAVWAKIPSNSSDMLAPAAAFCKLSACARGIASWRMHSW